MDWRKFLNGTPAKDYIYQAESYEEQVHSAAEYIKSADHILIGAGAGLSAAAGLTYGGQRFTDNFKEFIEKYGVRDMYSAGFYSYPSEEARWGYWSKHSYMNRIAPPALPLYKDLYELVKEKEYFVLTTNVDHQFQKAGFAGDRIFATQGDYGLIQCMRGCHPKTYDAIEVFHQMNQTRKDCVIPSHMVPRCPICGGLMTMNLRCDQYFVEDDAWNKAAEGYGEYLQKIRNKNVVLLELGVGFNTPIIIRYPFEKMVQDYKNYKLIRLNLDEAVIPKSFGKRGIGINADLEWSIEDIKSLI